jgi:hypothetical protein
MNDFLVLQKFFTPSDEALAATRQASPCSINDSWQHMQRVLFPGRMAAA